MAFSHRKFIIKLVRIAVDISPINSGHSTRGIGTYTDSLLSEFRKNKDKDISFEYFDGPVHTPRADIVHFPYFDFFFHTLPIKKVTKTVVTIHDAIPLVFPEHFKKGHRAKFNLVLQKIALKNVLAVICDSETSKSDLVKYLDIPKERVHVIYLAAKRTFKPIYDENKLHSSKSKYKLPSKFILYVGDINWNKNIPNLLKAIKLSGQNLVMVGKAVADEKTEQSKNIQDLISELKIGKKVSKLGYINDSDLTSIYNLASVTILPSYYEGFGLPVLESFACGTPVICSNNSSLLEVANSKAIFCNPNDPQDIAKKISKTLEMKKNKRSMSTLIAYASKFSWEKTAKETEIVYRKVYEK